MTYFDNHTHVTYSNIRLLDSVNRPKALIDKAIELGLAGIAITDHECLSAHMEVNQYAKKLQETNPDFTIALGNEIYLVDERKSGQRYYHFILIAKDAIGHKALRELSSFAWYQTYKDRGERVPTLKRELKAIIEKYKGHVIATTACLGSEVTSNALDMANAEAANDHASAKVYYDNIVSFLDFAEDLFGEDFYLECAASGYQEQIEANRKLYKISKARNIKMVLGTDAHYLTSEYRAIHKAYLNSKGGEREVDAFYEFSRLMSPEEAFELLSLSFPYDSEEIISTIMNSSLELKDKITFYSLERTQTIPEVEVKDYERILNFEGNYPTIKYLLNSDNVQERYWINECLLEMGSKKILNEEYLERLETEADVVKYIGDRLEVCLYSYFNTFKHYIDLFWECGSIVGPGRGSATGFLSNYLLGITQLDPIKWKLPYWRFLNKERAELPDIDIDLAPSKRPLILQKIREERGELGLVQVSTFGTEGTKSAVLTACRGYRSDDFPDGIDVDTAQYMSSLIPQERGFLWDIKDVVYGNEEKDRKPVTSFIKEVSKHKGLLEIIVYICGLVNKRSSHASGVILYGSDPFETSSFMRTPSGDLITSYDLHKAESAGDTKYDFLVTEVSDKIIKCFELLAADGLIEKDTLRNNYNKYLHPEVIDTENQAIWDGLAAGNILDVFQFNGGVGLAIAKKIQPQNPIEMTAANALMRLMAERGEESQQDRFYRIKTKGLEIFDKEMQAAGLTEEQKAIMHKWCDQYYGCVVLQEQMMEMLMDIAGFSLAEANDARKIVAKKQMSRIPELKDKIASSMKESPSFARYFWKTAIAPSLGYAFSLNHSLPYSFVGIQTIYLATAYNPIYWNTSCLIVNSGGADEDAGSSTDYGKIAKAIGDIKSAGINISLPHINHSSFGFAPDIENNRILFGLKGMLNIGDDFIDKVIANRPYSSPVDFLKRVKPSKQAMISLIKGGAFDEMEERKFLMAWYVWHTCKKKKKLNLQNMGALIKYNLLPTENEKHVTARRVYEFNRYLKAVCKNVSDTENYYLDTRALSFLSEIDESDLIVQNSNEIHLLKISVWDKTVYQRWMGVFRTWLTEHQSEVLEELNSTVFLEDWKKYASGTISAWEMETLCFYYHEHELAHLNMPKYGFSNFFSLPEEPVVSKSFSKGGKDINMFHLTKICGTCIAKDKTKSSVTLLTPHGVVNVKFRKEYFAMFDKQISEKGEDGVKHVVEKSWFSRGSMIVVMGMRSGDDFIAKKYASSGGHQLYKIAQIESNGDVSLTEERYQGGELEDV